MKLLLYSIVIIAAGFLANILFSDYSITACKSYYYILDETKDVLLTGCLMAAFPKLKWSLRFLMGFFIIRLCWEIYSIFNYADVNNRYFVKVLFILILTFICITAITSLTKIKGKWI